MKNKERKFKKHHKSQLCAADLFLPSFLSAPFLTFLPHDQDSFQSQFLPFPLCLSVRI